MQRLVYNTSPRTRLRWLAGLLLICFGCEDIFEKDISNSTIVLLTPADSILTETSLTEFRWEELEHAQGYRLQLAKPGFASPERYVLDTLITTTTYEFALAQGTYEWRVRAENGGSYSPYTTRTLFIDSMADLSKQILKLKSPGNSTSFSSTSILFRWTKIPIASEYELEIHNGSWSGELTLDTLGMVKDSARFTFPEGQYFWAMKAYGSSGNTPYSEIRSFYIDQTSPTVSTPNLPKSGDKIENFPYPFSWTRATDEGSGLYDSLFIVTSSGAKINGYPVKVLDSFYNVDSLPVGSYKWKLKTLDQAGNQSGYSVEVPFTVQ